MLIHYVNIGGMKLSGKFLKLDLQENVGLNSSLVCQLILNELFVCGMHQDLVTVCVLECEVTRSLVSVSGSHLVCLICNLIGR